MEEILRNLPQRAKEKRGIHKRILSKIAKKPPKNLDQTMGELHTAEFNRTDCLQCANCCKTTGPLFTGADIDRIAHYLRMKPGRFVETYLRRDEDGDDVLQRLPCSFLGADNRCAIYEVRPKACREFPHTDRKKFQQIGALTLRNVAICPAAFRIVEALSERMEG